MASDAGGRYVRRVSQVQNARCYWSQGLLTVIVGERRFHLDSTEGMKALKRNWFDSRAAHELRGSEPAIDSDARTDREGSPAAAAITAPLFDPDSPRRMLLIQEKLSGLRD